MQRAHQPTLSQQRTAQEQQAEQTEIIHHWLSQWAHWMRNNAAEIRRDVGYGHATVEGKQMITNYSTAEDDGTLIWDLRREKTVLDVDALLGDLKLQMPWTWWAICHRHGLATVWKFPRLDPEEAYWNAVEEMALLVEERGLVL